MISRVVGGVPAQLAEAEHRVTLPRFADVIPHVDPKTAFELVGLAFR